MLQPLLIAIVETIIHQYYLQMIQLRESLETLNLSQRYISHWTWVYGVRQYYSNFMDACIQKHPQYRILNPTSPKKHLFRYTQACNSTGTLQEVKQNFIEFDKNEETLIMQNDKSFPLKCMLMGCSEKGPQALGQFGQGMKISMIVLLKEGLKIKIQSGGTVYYPTLKPWDHKQILVGQYDKNVLYLNYQKKEKAEQTRVTIYNFTKQKFEEFKYVSLALLQSTKFERITCGGSTLIVTQDPKLKGKVFKKGVRLQLREAQVLQSFKDFSYNFQEIEVGRDRDCVNNVEDLYKLQSKILYDVINKKFDTVYLQQNPKFNIQILPKVIKQVYQYSLQHDRQTYYFHTFASTNKPMCDIFYKMFMQQNDKDFQQQELYPLNSSKYHTTLQNTLHKYGLPSSFYDYEVVGWQLYYILIKSTKYISIQVKVNKLINQSTNVQLSDNQRQIISTIVNKIALNLPQVRTLTISIKKIKGLVCFQDRNNIYISQNQLQNQDKVMRSIMKILLK